MNLLKTASLSAIPTALRMVTGIITNKIVAVYIGPAGVGLLGQMNNFFAILATIASAGIGSGVVKYAAEFSNDPEVHDRVVRTSLFLMLVPTILITIGSLLLTIPLAKFLFNDQSFAPYIAATALLIPAGVFSGFCMSLWNAHMEITKLVKRNIVATLISAATVPVFVIPFGVKGSIIAGAVAQLILFVILLPPLKTSSWFSWSLFRPARDREFEPKLLRFAAMAATSLVMVTCVQFFIRRYIGETLSYTDAGIWQSLNRISEMYLQVVMTSLGVYYIPKLSSLKSTSELKSEILNGYKIIMPITGIIGFLIWLFRHQIIAILYAPSFASMEQLFAYQMFGDFLKIGSWLLATLMVSKAMTRYFVITEIIFGILNLFLHIFLIQMFGLKGAPIAYFFLYIAYFLTMIFMFRPIILSKSDTNG